jgi:hypothetical protein
MDQLPAIPQGTSAFWATMFTLANVGVTLFCTFVVPALLKLGKAKLEKQQYVDDRADKGFQFVIAKQNEDREILQHLLDDANKRYEALNDRYVTAMQDLARYKTVSEAQEKELTRLRDQGDKFLVELTDLRARVVRQEEHDKNNQKNIDSLRMANAAATGNVDIAQQQH